MLVSVNSTAPVVALADLDLSSGTAPLRWELREAVLAGARNVVVDLHGVTSLSSAAVSALLNAHRMCRSRGGTVELVGCERQVLELLHRTGLWRVFTVAERETERSA